MAVTDMIQMNATNLLTGEVRELTIYKIYGWKRDIRCNLAAHWSICEDSIKLEEVERFTA